MRTSPPTERVVKILEAMHAAHPEGSSLAAVARATDIPKATCSGILNTLAEHGYLERDDGRFVLGPGAHRLARTFTGADLLTQEARRELSRLAVRLGVRCSAATVRDERMVTVASAGLDHAAALPVAEGRSYPIGGGIGLAFVMWRGDDVVERWLGTVSPSMAAKARDGIRRKVAECRASGSYVQPLDRNGLHRYQLLIGLGTDAIPPDVRTMLERVVLQVGATADGEPEGEPPVITQVASPVYDASGDVALLLFAYVDHARVAATGRPAAGTDDVVQAVVQATARLTASLGGVDPWGATEARPSGRRPRA